MIKNARKEKESFFREDATCAIKDQGPNRIGAIGSLPARCRKIKIEVYWKGDKGDKPKVTI